MADQVIYVVCPRCGREIDTGLQGDAERLHHDRRLHTARSLCLTCREWVPWCRATLRAGETVEPAVHHAAQ